MPNTLSIEMGGSCMKGGYNVKLEKMFVFKNLTLNFEILTVAPFLPFTSSGETWDSNNYLLKRN